MATKVGMYSATQESLTVPVGRDRKIRTALRTNQIVAIVTGPSEKKINGNINSSFFPSLFFYFFIFRNM